MTAQAAQIKGIRFTCESPPIHRTSVRSALLEYRMCGSDVYGPSADATSLSVGDERTYPGGLAVEEITMSHRMNPSPLR